MFEMAGGSIGDIGQRNIESVRKTLKAEGIRIQNQDVGSNYARTMLMDVAPEKLRFARLENPRLFYNPGMAS